MKSWTEAEAVAGNIIEAEGANLEYDTLKGRTAGLRRNNLPAQCIGRAQMTPNAMHRTSVFQDFALGAVYCTSGTAATFGQFNCMKYDDYGGGWRTAETWSLPSLLPGLLSVQVSLWMWFNVYSTIVNPKYLRFRVTSDDGQLIWTSGNHYTSWANMSIVGVVEVAGPVTLRLEWIYRSPKNSGTGGDDVGTVAQMFYGGGTAMFVNTHR